MPLINSKFKTTQLDTLHTPLITFSSKDKLTVGNVVEGGALITGGPGAGKTSTIGRMLAHALLRHQFGGLVLTAKSSEKALWKQYCKQTGREDSLIIVSPDESSEWAFNFLAYESHRPTRGGGLAMNIRQYLLDIIEAIQSSGSNKGANEQYWQAQLEKLLGACIDLLQMSMNEISVENLMRILMSAPSSQSEARDSGFVERSFCARCLAQAALNREKCANGARRFILLREYFCWEYPTQTSDKGKGAIATMLTGLLQNLRQPPLSDLFCGNTTFLPEYCREGAIILMDLPYDTYRNVGRTGQIIMKLAWQRAMSSQTGERPVFCWGDEAQHWISPTDSTFTSTSREYRAAMIYLTQNLPNLYTALGRGEEGRDAVLGTLGNLQTKVFMANDEPKTNQWASDVIGKKRLLREGRTITQGDNISHGSGQNLGFGLDGLARTGKTGNTSETTINSQGTSYSETSDYVVQSGEFNRLNRQVIIKGRVYSEAFIVRNGSPWLTTGEPYMKCLFPQTD